MMMMYDDEHYDSENFLDYLQSISKTTSHAARHLYFFAARLQPKNGKKKRTMKSD